MKHIEALKQKQSQLSARIQQLEAAEKLKAKRQETRRQILVGQHFLQKFRHEGKWQELKNEIQTSLKRDTDRKLFD